MEQKHSPLPWRVVFSSWLERIYAQDGRVVTAETSKPDDQFIVRACNHFDEMRGLLRRVVDATTIGEYVDIVDESGKLLAKLEADDGRD